ncbi:hypothetical protein BDZ89DRAFT_1116416 [Hymenopellis radicata]|nr:hypothetical protein BDZ89DRAFT_1116416 [Hymenopellis radicata]
MEQDHPPEQQYTASGRATKGGWGGKRAGSGRAKKTAAISTARTASGTTTTAQQPTAQLLSTLPHSAAPPAIVPSSSVPRPPPATFFLPRDTRQAIPGPAYIGGNRVGLTSDVQQPQNEPQTRRTLPSSSLQNDSSSVSIAELSRLNAELAFVQEHDVHGDIASGLSQIDDSLADELLADRDSDASNATAAQIETEASEPAAETVLEQYLNAFKRRIVKEIKKHGKPQCYADGQLFDRPPHPIFALDKAGAVDFSPDPLYHRDILVWLPHLLPHCPAVFKCTCGKTLSKHGYQNKPIARRVRRFPDTDYFLLQTDFGVTPTVRLMPDVDRASKEAIHISSNNYRALYKKAFLLASGTVKRLGPSPFSEMVSELQYRDHASRELIYYSAAFSSPQFSSFTDANGFAGCPPSTGYLKAMYTDYIGAHRIFMDRAQAALPLDIAKADHTFDFLKYMGGLNGEKIWKAAFNVVNQWEEVPCRRSSSDEIIGISLKAVGHPPTSLLYTDSPQTEQTFYEEIAETLAANVRHISTWTDLPKFEISEDVAPEFISHAHMLNEAVADILEEVQSMAQAGQVLVVAVGVKFRSGVALGKPCLDIIQLRTKTRVLIFKMTDIDVRSQFIPALRAFFTSSAIVKVGYQVRQALLAIGEALDLQDLIIATRSATSPLFVDLGHHAKLAGALEDPNMPLHALVGVILKRCLDFPPLSPYRWATSLSVSDITALYSETDCLWQLWSTLSKRESVGLRLSPVQLQCDGQLVTLVHSCKPVAYGRLVLDHPGYLEAVDDDNGLTRRINISASRTLIEITEVLVPGAIHNLHRQTIEWIYTHGRRIVAAHLPLHHLLLHSLSPLHSPSRTSSLHRMTEDTQFEIWEASPEDEYMYSDEEDDDFWDDLSIEADDDLDAIRVITEAVEHAQNILRQAADETIPTRVLDDAFHFMDRLLRLLSKKHSAFKAFSHDFSEAIFIRDKDDVAAVRAALEKRGINWEYAKRAKAAGLNRRIRRYIPNRHVLCERLTALFTGYQDIICSTQIEHPSRGRFFCDDARQMADRLLDTVSRGFLSDPAGIPLYYTMGKDRDGLTVYRTMRGTNSVEGGVHMAIRRVFGSLKASPILGECILISWTFRRNQSVGYHNRTGKKFRGHFDLWLSDEIVEICTLLDVKPSFPLPRLLATRIATSETFGIIPMDTKIAGELGITTLPQIQVDGVPHHRDLPVHILTRLSTRPMSQYRYLQLRQRTLYPVLPVATPAEYRKFKQIINNTMFRRGRASHPPHEAYKNINFTKLATFWNGEVDVQDRTITDPSQRLYYKIPAQLELHHKKTILWKSERSTLFLGQNAAALKVFTDIINSDDNMVTTLPPISLPNDEPDDTLKTVAELRTVLDSGLLDAAHSEPQRRISTRDLDQLERMPEDDVPQSEINPSAMDVDSTDASSTTPQPTYHQPTLQLGQGSLVIARGTTAKVLNASTGDRCAVCTKDFCEKRWECPGNGNRANCRCNHPLLQPGERVRIPEAKVIRIIAERKAAAAAAAADAMEY